MWTSQVYGHYDKMARIACQYRQFSAATCAALEELTSAVVFPNDP